MLALEARVAALETAVRLLLRRDDTRTCVEGERDARRVGAIAAPEPDAAAFDAQVALRLGDLLD